MYKKKLKAYLSKVEDIFVITDTVNVFEVNEVGARIFDLCNGKNNIEEISEKIARKYGANLEEVSNDVFEFLIELEKNGFVDKI